TPMAPTEEGASSVQEFSFDVPEHLSVEPEVTASVPEITLEPTATQEFDLQVSSVETSPVDVSEVEIAPESIEIVPETDASSEWEDMLSVEVEESEASAVGVTREPSDVVAQPEAHDTQKLELEPVAETQAAAEAVSIHAEPQQGDSAVCYMADDKVQEIQFFISQNMWQAANKALNELAE